ncbi:Uncharacterised protein [Chryseobacterium taihuense]|uniref:Uncharacterized protein n=1 Tax=Chryseobacterium taihuense TaxID=1141221 RepID=A0A4U8WJ95_9FLAO|nr:Uncharacterised protein [Chryseobacterium taihuense]
MKFTLGTNMPTFQHLVVNRLNINNVEKALKKTYYTFVNYCFLFVYFNHNYLIY